jgi:hypothetical protein
MLCEKCNQREAVVDYALGKTAKNTRRSQICEVCLEQLAPCMSTAMKITKRPRRLFGRPIQPAK